MCSTVGFVLGYRNHHNGYYDKCHFGLRCSSPPPSVGLYHNRRYADLWEGLVSGYALALRVAAGSRFVRPALRRFAPCAGRPPIHSPNRRSAPAAPVRTSPRFARRRRFGRNPRPPRSASRRSRPPPLGAPLLVGVSYLILNFLKNFRAGNVNLSEKYHNFGKIAKQLRHASDTCPFENRFVSLWTLFYVQPINLLKNYGKR